MIEIKDDALYDLLLTALLADDAREMPRFHALVLRPSPFADEVEK